MLCHNNAFRNESRECQNNNLFIFIVYKWRDTKLIKYSTLRFTKSVPYCLMKSRFNAWTSFQLINLQKLYIECSQ